MVNKIAVVLLGLLVLAGCKKYDPTLELKAPNVDNVLVVNSLFSNDSIINVEVTKSANFFKSETLDPINNATCALYEDGVFKENLIFKQNGNYESSFYPTEGKRYDIKVNASGYKDVSASTKLPVLPQVNFVKCKIDSTAKTITFDLTDIEAGKNYYSISLLETDLNQDNYAAMGLSNLASSNGFDFGNDEQVDVDEFYIDDGSFNQKSFSYTLKFDDGGQGFNPHYIDRYFILVVKSLNEDMYQYKRTLYKQQLVDGNPFAEPVLLYTNIKNGLGVFGGYTYDLDLVDYK